MLLLAKSRKPSWSTPQKTGRPSLIRLILGYPSFLAKSAICRWFTCWRFSAFSFPSYIPRRYRGCYDGTGIVCGPSNAGFGEVTSFPPSEMGLRHSKGRLKGITEAAIGIGFVLRSSRLWNALSAILTTLSSTWSTQRHWWTFAQLWGLGCSQPSTMGHISQGSLLTYLFVGDCTHNHFIH